MTQGGLLGSPARIFFQGQYSRDDEQGLRLLDYHLYTGQKEQEITIRLLARLDKRRDWEQLEQHVVYGELWSEWTVDVNVYTPDEEFNYFVVLGEAYIDADRDTKSHLTLRAVEDLRARLHEHFQARISNM